MYERFLASVFIFCLVFMTLYFILKFFDHRYIQRGEVRKEEVEKPEWWQVGDPPPSYREDSDSYGEIDKRP